MFILKKKKRGKLNRNICANALLELLWKNELECLLKTHGCKGLSNKNRRVLRQLALEHISLEDIRSYTLESLKKRQEWR